MGRAEPSPSRNEQSLSSVQNQRAPQLVIGDLQWHSNEDMGEKNVAHRDIELRMKPILKHVVCGEAGLHE